MFLSASEPTAVLLLPVVKSSRAICPTAVFFAPEVNVVKALLPIAVLLLPVTEASKAPCPRTVLLETEFAPLPTFTLLTDNIDPSKVNDDSPFKVLAVSDPVITLLSALLLIVVDVILLKLLPSP